MVPYRNFPLLILLSLMLVASPPRPAAAGGDNVGGHPHHLALFVGGGVEDRGKDTKDKGLALGLDYEYRFRPQWGVGVSVETLGQDTVREILVVALASFHPGASAWRIMVGPGIESLPGKDKAVLRVGLGYAFDLGQHWTLAPEVYVDFIETGNQTYIVGVALGYGF